MYVSRTSDVDVNINLELVKLDDLFSSLLSKTIDEGIKCLYGGKTKTRMP